MPVPTIPSPLVTGRVQLRWLEYFAAVAEELHFRRAAEALHVSAPTLSHQIRQLEAALGVVLFERTSRRVRLSEPGKALYARVRLGLDLLAQGVDEASALGPDAASPTVAVGFVHALASGVMPAALRRFHAARPTTRVRLEQLGSADQLQRLAAGTLDAGFFWRIGDAEPLPPLRIRALATMNLHVALPANHRFAAARALELAQLADEVWLAAADESDRQLRNGFVDLCRSHGFTPVVRNEATWIGSLQALVAAGLGVSASPAPSIHPPGDGVVLVPLHGCTVQLVAARGAPGSPRVDRLVDDVETAMSELAA